MKILIVTDAWTPQINGVVRTIEATTKELTRMGHKVCVVGPEVTGRFVFSLPSYPQIKLELFPHRRLKRLLRDFGPKAIHIATEGPLGWAMRGLCLEQGLPFTTSYHTSFPEYLAARVPRFLAPVAARLSFAVLRLFHKPSRAVMVATPTIESALKKQKVERLVQWSRGVDTGTFKPWGKDIDAYKNLPRPLLLNVGRVAVEKNLRAFLDLKTEGSKVVIGAGPTLETLRSEYPDAHFLGAMSGETLARHYAAADLFVFPSKTDTFGLVLLEACAAGLRCAAYPVTGPADVFADPSAKAFVVLDADLQKAVDRALSLPDNPDIPRAYAARLSWAACTEAFFKHLQAS